MAWGSLIRDALPHPPGLSDSEQKGGMMLFWDVLLLLLAAVLTLKKEKKKVSKLSYL